MHKHSLYPYIKANFVPRCRLFNTSIKKCVIPRFCTDFAITFSSMITFLLTVPRVDCRRDSDFHVFIVDFCGFCVFLIHFSFCVFVKFLLFQNKASVMCRFDTHKGFVLCYFDTFTPVQLLDFPRLRAARALLRRRISSACRPCGRIRPLSGTF